jgi:hypothetical protein
MIMTLFRLLLISLCRSGKPSSAKLSLTQDAPGRCLIPDWSCYEKSFEGVAGFLAQKASQCSASRSTVHSRSVVPSRRRRPM